MDGAGLGGNRRGNQGETGERRCCTQKKRIWTTLTEWEQPHIRYDTQSSAALATHSSCNGLTAESNSLKQREPLAKQCLLPPVPPIPLYNLRGRAKVSVTDCVRAFIEEKRTPYMWKVNDT